MDWKARAEREAAAILDESGYAYVPGGVRNASEAQTRGRLITLIALGWLQGANFADHLMLERVEDAFDELRAAL